MRKPLYESLTEYCRGDAYPFHMPGHKRRMGGMADPFLIDITEIDGFDNLHHPEGILKDAQKRAAALYGAQAAFYLVGGSTAGVLAGISAALHTGQTGISAAQRTGQTGFPSGKTVHEQTGSDNARPVILFARNAHKSAYHALYLNRARPVWLYPEEPEDGQLKEAGINGRISPEQVKAALAAEPDAAAVFITSPTYDGVVSDVEQIAAVAHERGIPLIVDQAHGAHFGIHPALPESATRLGSDIVITSLHKTLPSLTQTGLLLLGGDLISPEMIRRFLNIYQTSSPSYVLMASIDRCVQMMRTQGEEIFDRVLAETERFRRHTGAFRNIKLLPTDDPTRILISAAPRLSGREICAILRERFHIEAEMDLPGYVLCLVGAGDTKEGFDRLLAALARIDIALEDGKPISESILNTEPEKGSEAKNGEALNEREPETGTETGKEAVSLQTQLAAAHTRAPEQFCYIHEAWDAVCERVPIRASAGRVSGDFAYLYPPGMPLIVPGERITAETAALFWQARQAGFSLTGMEDLQGEFIRVLAE